MAQISASVPKGTRDFSPDVMARRNFIFDTIREIYRHYGFQPLETPAMEKLDTLTGKYGEEGDRLIFKILNSGNYFSAFKDDTDIIDTKNSGNNTFTRKISEKALRYDLTVPFARYVVQHRNDITFPFKRYQIQPVWRADNPQKGRFREFYQCDADVIGTTSLVCEAEFIMIFSHVLEKLGIKGYEIRVNNRKILAGIAEVCGLGEHLTEFTVALDKLDKIGAEKVTEEMATRGLDKPRVQKAMAFMETLAAADDRLATITGFVAGSEKGSLGCAEMAEIFEIAGNLVFPNGKVVLDATLARGLDYYTGCIFEVTVPGSGFGSIAGGGRYDDLTGIFGLKDVSGCGISFGADRIYELMLQENLFPERNTENLDLLLLNFGKAEAIACFKLAEQLRSNGIKCAVYPDAKKIGKQMDYANALRIPFVGMMGSEEIQNGTIQVKNMITGEQKPLSVAHPENISADIKTFQHTQS